MISVHCGLLIRSLDILRTGQVLLVIEQIDLGVGENGISLSHLLSSIVCSCLILEYIFMIH